MMQSLSLERINQAASYPIIRNEQDGFFHFFTDYGVHYSVGFIEDDVLVSGESYQLIIANLNNRKSMRDRKVRDTILVIVDEFFRCNNVALLYICETGDNKQGLRSRLFEYWFSTYSRKSFFTILSSSVEESEGVVNHAAIILRNDNLHLTEIIAEFSATIQALNQKPE